VYGVLKKITVLGYILLFINSFAAAAYASNSQSTGYTYTLTVNGKVGIAQDAYLPAGMYLDLGLNQPQDLYITNDRMYIADTGNKRIVSVDLKTGKAVAVGEGILEEPTGVSADKDGRIYAADNKKKEAYRFNSDGSLSITFKKPTIPAFGRNQGFNPKKVSAADDGGVYLISEGSTAGIVQINGTGDFLGYFASNNVSVSLFERLQDIFLTEEQKKIFLKRTPPSFGNLFRGPDGLIYTINRGQGVNVKKHSISGLDLFRNSRAKIALADPADLCVAEDGRIYVLQASGMITELTYDGYLIAHFGGNSEKTDRIGLFEIPAGIGIDSQNNVYVLDGQRSYIQVFQPTPIQRNIHKALDAYNNGNYTESQKLLKEAMKFNDTSFLAHLYMGLNYLQQNNYEEALGHFSIVGEKGYYSAAYWELRNIQLQNNLGKIILAFLLLYVVLAAYKFISRKKGRNGLGKRFVEKMRRYRLLNDFINLKYALLHPIDNAYNIRYGITGSYLSATLLYVLVFVILVLSQVGCGFVYSVNTDTYSVSAVFTYFVLAIGLFTVGNYFISSVNDGNGTFRSIYVGTAYCFAPMIFIIPFFILFANFATSNEQFLLITTINVVIVWCIINIFLVMMEIHEYSFKKALFNIFMTLFFMGVAILASSMVYLLLNQVWQFIQGIIMEVALRVKAS
jgi:sugar lactone lactonase YvrE